MLFAPVILCFSMPSCAQEIVEFVTEHTVDVEGVGSVCSYSLFDFGRSDELKALCFFLFLFEYFFSALVVCLVSGYS